MLITVIDDVQQTTDHLIVAELGADVTLIADRDRIAQVMMSLLTNAIRYSPQADRIVVRTTHDGEHIATAVQDVGIGIPKEDQPYVSDPFYRVTADGHDGYEG